MVGPWQYQCSPRVGPGRVYRVLPPSQYPVYHPSRCPPTALPGSVAHHAPVRGHPGTCTYDRFTPSQGDPRGVKRTGYRRVGRGTHGAVSPLAPPNAQCSPARSLAPAQPQISINQLNLSYISVISQYYLRYLSILSISQYFSVFSPQAWSPAARPSCRINEERAGRASARGY